MNSRETWNVPMNRKMSKVISFANILLLDENKLFHRTLKSLLNNFCFKIISVSDIDQIFTMDSQIVDQVYDLIIMEYEYTCCSFEKLDLFLSQSEKFRDIPRIILTGFGKNLKHLTSRDIIIDILNKPIKLDELLNALHRAVEQVRILIVGDEQSLLMEKTRKMLFTNYSVNFECDPLKALKKLEMNHFKLILVSEELQDMPLPVFCTWVRTLPSYKLIPVLPVYNLIPDEGIRKDLKALDVTDFILSKDLESELDGKIQRLVFQSGLKTQAPPRGSEIPPGNMTAEIHPVPGETKSDLYDPVDVDDMDSDLSDMFDKLKDIL